jgi:hypothetical protein
MANVDDCFLSAVKEHVSATARSLTSSNEQVCEAFHKVFWNAINTRGSACSIVIGPVGTNKMDFVTTYLQRFQHSHGIGYKLAVIDGDVIETDTQAVTALADQLIEATSTSNFSTNSDDIYQCFRQSYTETKPIVIVINSVETFAKHSRQMFLYLLLDLMQKKDLLFIVVGLTTNCFIQTLLEKRITSRLNASYLYLRPVVPRPPALVAGGARSSLPGIGGHNAQYDSADTRTAHTCINLASRLVLPGSLVETVCTDYERLASSSSSVGRKGIATASGSTPSKARSNGSHPQASMEDVRRRVEALREEYNCHIIASFLDSRATQRETRGFCFVEPAPGGEVEGTKQHQSVPGVVLVPTAVGSGAAETSVGASTSQEIDALSLSLETVLAFLVAKQVLSLTGIGSLAPASASASASASVNGVEGAAADGIVGQETEEQVDIHYTRFAVRLLQYVCGCEQTQGAYISRRGGLHSLVHCCLGWGMGDEFFSSACHAAVYRLHSASAHTATTKTAGSAGEGALLALTRDLFEDVIVSQLDTDAHTPLPSLSVLLSSLTRLELLVLVAVIKLYRSEDTYLGGGSGGHTSVHSAQNAGLGGTFVGSTKEHVRMSGVAYNWAKVYEMFSSQLDAFSVDNLSSTSSMGQPKIPYARAVAALESLVHAKILGVSNTFHSDQQPKGVHAPLSACISDRTMVYLYIPVFVLRTEFQYESESAVGAVGGIGGQGAIKVYGDLIQSLDLTQLTSELLEQERENSGAVPLAGASRRPRKKVKLMISESVRQTVLQVFVNKPM